MELQAVTYYNHDRFFNSFYLITATLQKYLAQEIFKNDGTRMIYASAEFAFRQRLNLLNLNTNPELASLSLPFGCIYRRGAWDIDPLRYKATTMIYNSGTTKDGQSPDGIVRGRFINAKCMFDCTLFFGRDDDAQVAYEALMWMRHPTPKLLRVAGFEYKHQNLFLPLTLQVDNLQFSPDYKEKEWLQSTRVVPISFTIEVSSNILDQYRQAANSTLFDTYVDDELAEIKLTETVILDFLAYARDNQYVDREGILLEVQSILTPDPALNGALVFSPEIDPETHLPIYEDTSVHLTWTFGIQPDPGAIPPEPGNQAEVLALYETDVRIVCSNGTSYTVPMAAGQYTINDLEPNSSYEFSIFFIAKNGAVTKYTTIGYTTVAQVAPNLKGMIGLTW